MLELLLMSAFSSMVFFSVLSSIFGVLVRALLENESAKFCLLHSFIVSIVAGTYAFFTTSLGNLSLDIRMYIGTFIFFFMAGYVLSDLLNSLIFIIKNPYNPLKIFAKRKMRNK